MAKFAAYFIVAVVACHSASVFARQVDFGDYDFGQSGNNNGNNNNLQPTQPPSGTTTTTAAPEFTACVNACPALPQYSPVCGTNQISYNNVQRLQCAQRCGLNVRVLHVGTCGPSAGGK